MAATQLRVNITTADVESGEPGSDRACPVARAINRVLPEGQHAQVDYDGVCIYDNSNTLVAIAGLPRNVARWVRAFDLSNGAVRPERPDEFVLNLFPWRPEYDDVPRVGVSILVFGTRVATGS